VNGWYDDASGQPVTPPALSGRVPAPEVAPIGPRVAFLTDLMAALASEPGYSAEWGSDTDVTIASNPVDARWGAGHKKTEYTAALKVVEAERTVYFWEVLKERSSGIPFGTFESESYPTVGAKRSGTRHEATIGPGSTSWEWGYGTLRKLVEDVAARHGFGVHVVFTRAAAVW
jgi:hypothetical protein